MDDGFAIMHIPKTAGTSLIAELNRLYGDQLRPERFDPLLADTPGEIAHFSPEIRELYLGESSNSAGHLVGHFALSTLTNRVPIERIATVFREPTSRLLSQQAFHAAIPAAELSAWASSTSAQVGQATFRDAFGDDRFAGRTDNLQLRMLLFPHPALSGSTFIDQRLIPELAEEALTRSKSLGFVGLVEEGPQLWARLSQWLGASIEPRRDNATSFDANKLDWVDGWTDELVELIEHRTRGDRIVWNHFADDLLKTRSVEHHAQALSYRYVARAAVESDPKGTLSSLKNAESKSSRLEAETRALSNALSEAADQQAEMERDRNLLNETAIDLARQVRKLQAELDELQNRNRLMIDSTSWKIGYAATQPVRLLRAARFRVKPARAPRR